MQLLSMDDQAELLRSLKSRFGGHGNRHVGIEWPAVEAKLIQNADALWSLREMERTGGEPDVVGIDSDTGEYIFCDCSPETPKDRRSLCYDRAALDSRKEHKPKGSAVDMATAMGIALLSEREYQELQALGEFDTKTSSWLATPREVRGLGGAIFGDRRFNRVFFYHNGAESYYASRGFRGSLRV